MSVAWPLWELQDVWPEHGLLSSETPFSLTLALTLNLVFTLPHPGARDVYDHLLAWCFPGIKVSGNFSPISWCLPGRDCLLHPGALVTRG